MGCGIPARLTSYYSPAATSSRSRSNTGHSTAATLMDTYAHTQDKPRLELTEKIEATFYKETTAKESQQSKLPEGTKNTGQMILEAIESRLYRG